MQCQIEEASFDSAELGEARFDAITAVHVLEHSSSPRRFLEKCRRLLKSRGVMMVEVPDFGCRHARQLRENWIPLYPDTHLYHFTATTLRGLANAAGFDVVRVRRYGGLGILAGTSEVGSSSDKISVASSLKKRMFAARRFVYRYSSLKRPARYLYWHMLRMNEYLRLFAIRRD